MRPKRFFLAGAAHVDRRGRPSGTLRRGASNPGTVTESSGGAVFNAAIALRLLGAEATLASGRGGDASGERVAKDVRRAGIEDLSVTWLDRRSATYTAILDHHGELVAGIADMDVYDLLRGRLFQRRHVRDAMARADALILDANLPQTAIDRIVQAFDGRPIAAIGVSPAKVLRLQSNLPALSALFVSRAEAANLVEASAATGIAVLARLLAEHGAGRAVITDGPSDVAILDGGKILLQGPPPVARLRDVTGAGDTLAATATFGLLEGLTFVESVRFGMAAASRRIGVDDGPSEDPRRHLQAVADAMAPPRAIMDD